MTEAQWLACDTPGRMLESLDCLRSRKWRLIVCACCRRIWDRLPDLSRAAVEAAERFADGEADSVALAAAHSAAWPRVTTVSDPAYHPGQAALIASAPAPTHMALFYANPAAPAVAEGQREERLARLRQWYREDVKFIRDVFGNPFRPVAFSPEWRTDTALSLAQGMYESRDFSAMPILADALQDAGCENADILNHCRSGGVHVRGCWVVDLVLGKE